MCPKRLWLDAFGYFTPESMENAARLAGMKVLSIQCFGPNRWFNTVVHARCGLLWRRVLYYPLRALEKLSLANCLVSKVFGNANSIAMLHYPNPRGTDLRCLLSPADP